MVQLAYGRNSRVVYQVDSREEKGYRDYFWFTFGWYVRSPHAVFLQPDSLQLRHPDRESMPKQLNIFDSAIRDLDLWIVEQTSSYSQDRESMGKDNEMYRYCRHRPSQIKRSPDRRSKHREGRENIGKLKSTMLDQTGIRSYIDITRRRNTCKTYGR